MQVTKGTLRMREQCVPGSLSSSPAQESGNEATVTCTGICLMNDRSWYHVVGKILFAMF